MSSSDHPIRPRQYALRTEFRLLGSRHVAIIDLMALPKKNSAAEEKVQAVYEKGVLRPLRPLHLKERTRVLVTLHAQLPWRKELDSLLRRMKARSKSIPQKLVDAEVTRARAEVKAKRRVARRSS